ncbi:MAG TPA: ATP-dependent protease LonB, partial [Archaeoglobus veneficus]|nr:ATP-dependent protease LonB [Archaeoglobus veneficus]
KGKEIVEAYKQEAMKKTQARNFFLFMLIFLIVGYAILIERQFLWGIVAGALLFLVARYMMPKEEKNIPKLLVSNANKETAPFEDATGAHAGALFGDVRHDPFQSGGLETPAHERVEAGAIHRAHKGVLYIDEINTLTIESQQKILTAMQEKKFPITGQSERSSGAMVRTDPVPCDFILVAAGNLDALMGMHPALRSRIEGYGYEIYMNDTIEDTMENRRKFVRFVAQEVVRDGKIPHLDKYAVAEIIKEAKRRAGRRNHLTLRLRELGGLIRTAGDIAKAEGSEVVRVEHVLKAKKIAKTIEEQLADKYIERRRDYRLFINEGAEIGRVNGLAVIGESAGIVLPIIAEITPALSKEEGKVIATGRLQEIAREAVTNVSAIIKKFTGKDISNKDVHIQFVGTYEGVEGDSASISIATAVISAMEGIPVDQSVAMTGSLSVKGEVLPVGGVTQKIEAAIQAGLKKVIIPKDNMDDVMLDAEHEGKIEIIPVSRIDEVLEYALVSGDGKDKLLGKLKEMAALV